MFRSAIVGLVLIELVWMGRCGPTLEAQNPRFFPVPQTQLQGWRSKRYIRNGPILFGSVYREKVGNGITPVGGQVLTTAIQTSPQIIGQLIPLFSAGVVPVSPMAAQFNNDTSAAQPGNGAAQAAAKPNPIIQDLLDRRTERDTRLRGMYTSTLTVLTKIDVTPIAPPNPNTWADLPPLVVTPPSPLAGGNVKRLTVGFGPNVSFSQADVLEVLRQMNQIAGQNQPNAPFSERMSFELASLEPLETIDGPPAISTKFQLEQLSNRNRRADVLVVQSLAFCNEANNTEGVIGCAGQDFGAHIIVEWQDKLATAANIDPLNAILWLHELCHNGSGEHVTLSPTRVMNTHLTPTAIKMVQREVLQLASVNPDGASAAYSRRHWPPALA